MKILLFLFTDKNFFYTSIFSFILLFSCTNYTVSKQNTVPPILVAISQPNSTTINGVTTIPTGYLLVFKAGNPELFFAGYRLYVGNTESEAMNPADITKGTDCSGGHRLTPNQPIEYSAEISSSPGDLAPVNSGENANRICKFQVSVTTGQYVAIRSLLRSTVEVQAQSTLNISASSNALIIP